MSNNAAPQPPVSRPRKCLRFAWRAMKFLLLAGVTAWSALALYYSNLPWPSARFALAVAFVALAAITLVRLRTRGARTVFAGAFLAVVVWFSLIRPSHDRPWRGDVAVMPRAMIDADDDHVSFTGYRDFVYRTRRDFERRFQERTVQISHLQAVDLVISYWEPGPVAHTFVSFRFDNADPVCISIETRPEEGEGFAPIQSMFKQFELIYVVGSERDVIRSRTNYRDEDVFVYPIITSPDVVRRLFREYIARINQLADRPEWYHLLKNNCSLNIVRYANAAGREGGWDIRHLLNGWFDRYLYRARLVDTSMPFEQLRAQSCITAVARASADDETFSSVIRAGLPGGPAAWPSGPVTASTSPGS